MHPSTKLLGIQGGIFTIPKPGFGMDVPFPVGEVNITLRFIQGNLSFFFLLAVFRKHQLSSLKEVVETCQTPSKLIVSDTFLGVGFDARE